MASDMETDNDNDSGNLLTRPNGQNYGTALRTSSSYHPLATFNLEKDKQYKQQYSDLYFLRLAKLKPAVDKVASDAWDGLEIRDEVVRRVERVLDVRQGELCWVTGTIYMEMPLKPNILEDILKDNWIAPDAVRSKYISEGEVDKVMLEDESGRLCLIGNYIRLEMLVTGCIIAVMGTENSDGDFDVLEMRFPDIPPQPERWALRPKSRSANGDQAEISREKPASETKRRKLALISGLDIDGDITDTLTTELLIQYLLGETTGGDDQQSAQEISRLIIAGNSLAEATPAPVKDESGKKIAKKYGYHSSSYNPAPTEYLDTLLSELLPSLPVTLMPGATDLANTSLPQQPLHSALFPHSRNFAANPAKAPDKAGWFDSVTNPFEAEIEGWRVIGSGGQTLDDVYKYVISDDRLDMMEKMCRWRCIAPTAPDTLWCYPFQEKEPFVLNECPHIFFVGNQPKFDTCVVRGQHGQEVTLITIPKFKETGEIVLVDMEDLKVQVVKFQLHEHGDS